MTFKNNIAIVKRVKIAYLDIESSFEKKEKKSHYFHKG